VNNYVYVKISLLILLIIKYNIIYMNTIVYLITIFIILFLLWNLFKNRKKNNIQHKCVQNIEGNSETFIEPKHMFLKVLNDIKNSPKIILDNVVSKCYLDKNTIEPVLNEKINKIIRDVISHLNRILSEEEYFIKELQGVYIIKDDKGNFRLIITSFLYDIKNYYQTKFILDVVYMNDEYYLNYLDVDERAVNNILNRYDIRSVDKNPEGLLLRYNMVSDDLENILNDHYKSNNSILDFKNINNNQNEYNILKISDLSKYYLPEGVPDLFSPMFCEKNTNKWDTSGVPFKNNNIPDTCIANNNAITKILNLPYDAPGVLNTDKTSDYSWMFSIFSNPGTVTKDWTNTSS